MEFREIEQFVEVNAVLEEGVDFTKEELVPDMLTGGALKHLSSDARKAITKKHGFDECSWSGSYNAETGMVPVVLRSKTSGMNRALPIQADFLQKVYGTGIPCTVRIDTATDDFVANVRKIETAMDEADHKRKHADLFRQVDRLKALDFRDNPELCIAISTCLMHLYEAIES